MQEKIITPTLSFYKSCYDAAMHPGGRPTKRKRPELGERIAQARERAGLSQYEVADRMGVTQTMVVSWERKVKSIRSDTLAKIATVLDVTSDELLGLKPPKETTPKGRWQKLIKEASELPRRQQDKLIEQIETTLAGHKLRDMQRKAS